MVRLVFRPYTQIWSSICTSEWLQTSTRVSPGFILFRHSSPSFGSQHVCSHSDHSSEEFGPADCATRSNHCYFHCAPGFATPVLAQMLDSLVRVSRRGKENHFVKLRQDVRERLVIISHYTLFRKFQPTLTQGTTQRPLCKQWGKCILPSTGFLRFPFSNFRYSLTLFSKFFASFPHGTCTLSVSHQYLALDGIYHPLRAAIPNNSTRRHQTQKAEQTGVSPSKLPCSKGLGSAS